MVSQLASFASDAPRDVPENVPQLRQAFREIPIQTVPRGKVLTTQSALFMLESGLGYRAFSQKNRRRVILDLLAPGDIAGLEQLFIQQPDQQIVAASDIRGHLLPAASIRELLSHREFQAEIATLIVEARARADQLNLMLSSMPARERIVAMLLGFYHRLRRRQFIQGPSFNFPLTQEDIADHLGLTVEHVNRVLRRLREDKLLIADRGVIILRNIRRLQKLIDEYGTLIIYDNRSISPA